MSEPVAPYAVGGTGNAWSVVGWDAATNETMAAFFTGPHAETRARNYAAFMNDPYEVTEQLRLVRKELGGLYGIVNRLRAMDPRPL